MKNQHNCIALEDLEVWQELSENELDTVRGGYKPWYCKYTGCQDDIVATTFEGVLVASMQLPTQPPKSSYSDGESD